MGFLTRPFTLLVLAVVGVLAAVVFLDTGGSNASMSLDPRISYSADFSYTIDSLQVAGSTQHIPGATRREFQISGMSMVSLERWSSDRSYLIFPNQQKYIAVRSSKRRRSLAILKFLLGAFGDKARAVGKESHEGRDVTIYKFADKSGSIELWVTKDGLIVRLEGEGRVRGKTRHISFRLTNIDIRPQEPSLFDLPDGFQKVPSIRHIKR
jgi:hypothetical protein